MKRPESPRFATVVSEVQAGDDERFSELVTSFQDMAVGYAYSILGDFHLAEDAAQESVPRRLSSPRRPSRAARLSQLAPADRL